DHYPRVGADRRPSSFGLDVLAFVGIPHERAGGGVPAALPAAVDQRISPGCPCRGYPLASPDFLVCDGAERPIFFVFRVCNRGGGLSVGVVGDRRHGGYRSCTVVGRSLRGTRHTAIRSKAHGGSGALGGERARAAAAAVDHVFGLSAGARIPA